MDEAGLLGDRSREHPDTYLVTAAISIHKEQLQVELPGVGMRIGSRHMLSSIALQAEVSAAPQTPSAEFIL
eukprot:1161340-Pelagomonas_calceolata.AAC.8